MLTVTLSLGGVEGVFSGILCAACDVVVGICCVTDTGGDMSQSVAEKATPSSPVVCVV